MRPRNAGNKKPGGILPTGRNSKLVITPLASRRRYVNGLRALAVVDRIDHARLHAQILRRALQALRGREIVLRCRRLLRLRWRGGRRRGCRTRQTRGAGLWPCGSGAAICGADCAGRV